MNISQEDDRVSGRTVIIVGVVAIVISAVAIAIAWWILSATAAPRQPALPGPHAPIAGDEAATRAIDMGRQLFAARRDLLDRSATMQRLDSYGWVNQQERIVHIPIRRAMELYVQRTPGSEGRP